MLTTTCFCGAELAGPDRDAQVAAARSHMDEAHAEFPLSDTQIRNYCERVDQLTGPTERREPIDHVELVDISADRLDDILAFFDHDVFADNAAWASCYCMAHHVPDGESGEAWAGRTWQQNRADLAERIRNGDTTGVLAYVGGRLAAWCNASTRDCYPEHAKGEGDDRTGVVVCFAVAPPYRGHGLAKQMLDAACEQLRQCGVEVVEGHPATEPANQQSAYRGTPSLFSGAGFEPAGTASERTAVFIRRLT